MMLHCPQCQSTRKERLSARKLSDGSYRKRYECQMCKHRWSVWTGEQPVPGKRSPPKQTSKSSLPAKLTSDQVRYILQCLQTSDVAVSKQLGISREAVRQVRVGITYGNLHTDLPRRVTQAVSATTTQLTDIKLTCTYCSNWRDVTGCLFEVPDCISEGIEFASDCALYIAKASKN